MTKQTAAQRHTTAHKTRRVERLTNRPLPHFDPGSVFVVSSVAVLADKNGELIRIDSENGTIRRLRWEQ